MPEVHELVRGPISCHCWNGDRTSESLLSPARRGYPDRGEEEGGRARPAAPY